MRTPCQSVKSGTGVDCFTLHRCRYTVVAEELRSVNTTTPMEPTGIRLFKKGLAVEDINQQGRPGAGGGAGEKK